MDLNRGQTLGLNLDMHIVLDAGAGTGKTACIVQRVLEHYLSEDQRATRLLPTGPRDVDLGGGLLNTPKVEREDLRKWGGLLPTEVVVLTFTVKAAEEMRGRLRSELSRLRAGPRGNRDGLRYDPRIRNEGLIEQLTMLLDEAPIGTIDSFLNRLVSSHRNLLGDRPTHEQMSDAQRALLMDRSMSSLWRISNERHAGDLGVISVSPKEFIDSRNRLSYQLGGRSRAQKIVSKLLHNSLFVDSIRRSLTNSEQGVNADSLRNMFLSHINENEISEFTSNLLNIGSEWLNLVKERHSELGLVEGLADGAMTRINSLDNLIATGIPDDLWDKLLWIRHFTLATCSLNAAENLIPSVFPNNILPKTDNWPSGILKLSSIKNKDTYAEIRDNISSLKQELIMLYGSISGMRIRSCALIADLLEPRTGPPNCPVDSTVWPIRISDPFPSYIEDNLLVLDADTDARIISDLLIVHSAASDVQTELRLLDGLHDHSDVAQSAEDLLLARCPRICRRWYPPDIVAALDDIDNNRPWRDEHVFNAISLCGDPDNGKIPKEHSEYPMRLVKDDLERRFQVLKTIRRRFRAFIIDEAQDNSNQQWRMLSRLWGEREQKSGDPEPPNSPWQPTICWVGDQKQSIYGFRQAQVSGMARYTEQLRLINQHEYGSESRLLMKPALRRLDSARDPRLVEISSFVSGIEYVNHRPIPEEAWVQFDRADDGRALAHSDVVRRAEGHIDLVTNYRTCDDLLQTMNEWWLDIFDDKHNLFPGDWYASPKSLRAHREKDNGSLEWLFPIATDDASDPNPDLTIPLDPYELGSAAKPPQLENELVATRIRSLIDGVSTTVLHSEESEEEIIIPPQEKVEPRDIMVLMPARTHMYDLVRRLDNLGIPALADQEGGLMEQPVVMSLNALLQLAARRSDVGRAAMLARTALVGFNDSQLQNYLDDNQKSLDLLDRLQYHSISDEQKELFLRWKKLADSNRLMQMLEDTLDYSDLLLTYPSQVDRQYAEQFLSLVRSQIAEAGGDPVLLSDRLRRLSSVSGKLLPGEAMPPSNAVRVMTIHGSKGLQSKVVIVCGLFNENQSNLGQSLRDNILVSGELFSPRAKPWKSRDGIDSGSWRLSEAVLKSQVQAEARRLLYVACTRVKDKLILAGAPKNASIESVNGNLEFKWEYTPNPRFGWMLLEAFRQASHRNEEFDSPWLLEKDNEKPSPLQFSDKGKITLNPFNLLSNPHLCPGILSSLPIYHHPEMIIPSRENISPLVSFTRLQESAKLPVIEQTSGQKLREVERKKRIAPHNLDSAHSCLRKHWLKEYVGLSTNSIKLPYLVESTETNDKNYLAPDELGILFHRLVELGLPNPGSNNSSSTMLSEQWITPSPNRMNDPNLISQVIDELLPNDVDRDITSQILMKMSERFMQGKLGRMTLGETVDGLNVDGLRTEWPFLINVETGISKIPQSRWSPYGEQIIQYVSSFIFELDGIVDLVLCQTDADSTNTIRAIDLKTIGCTSILEPPIDAIGTIFETPENIDDETNRTTAEMELLNNHKMQLYLYHLCLVRQESMRAANGLNARVVLPPAIIVAATGRLISWTEEEFRMISNEFKSLLQNLAIVDLEKKSNESDFPRLSGSKAVVCNKCPFYSGTVRLCGPEGIALGSTDS